MSRKLTGTRIFVGETINVILLSFVIGYATHFANAFASEIIGKPVVWPQFNFMSSYSEDERNGYLSFVAAVVVVTFLASGVFGGWAGASPGKAIVGIRYIGPDGQKAAPVLMRKRAALLSLFLLPILLAGPTIGFVFGPHADSASLWALAASLVAFAALVFDWTGNGSWVHRTAGVTPAPRK